MKTINQKKKQSYIHTYKTNLVNKHENQDFEDGVVLEDLFDGAKVEAIITEGSAKIWVGFHSQEGNHKQAVVVLDRGILNL